MKNNIYMVLVISCAAFSINIYAQVFDRSLQAIEQAEAFDRHPSKQEMFRRVAQRMEEAESSLMGSDEKRERVQELKNTLPMKKKSEVEEEFLVLLEDNDNPKISAAGLEYPSWNLKLTSAKALQKNATAEELPSILNALIIQHKFPPMGGSEGVELSNQLKGALVTAIGKITGLDTSSYDFSDIRSLHTEDVEEVIKNTRSWLLEQQRIKVLE